MCRIGYSSEKGFASLHFVPLVADFQPSEANATSVFSVEHPRSRWKAVTLLKQSIAYGLVRSVGKSARLVLLASPPST